MSTQTKMAGAALGIKALAFICFGILAISLSVQLNKQKTKFDALKFSAIFGMYGFCVAYGFETIIFIIEISLSSSNYSLWDNDTFSLFQYLFWNLCYTFSWSSFYIFMILRVKQTFNDTNSIYAVNQKILYLHLINAILPPILIIIAPFYEKIFIIIDIIWICLTFIGSFHIIYIFNHNLYLLIISQNQTQETNLNQTQENMIKTVSKHSVLGGFTLISLGICAITHTLNIGSIINIFWIKILLIHIGAIIICISGLSIYLGFNFNKSLYLKLCINCDNCATKRYSELVKDDKKQKQKEKNRAIKSTKYEPVAKNEE